MKKLFLAATLAVAAILMSCGDNKKGIRMGSLSEFDSLSYAIGANMGLGINYEMRDVPFDFKRVEEGIKEGVKSADEEHDKMLELLRAYFMTKRGPRARAIAEERAHADSVRLASGDSTKVEYPVADEKMFESEAERDSISYAFGSDIGYNLAHNDLPLQLVWVCKAMTDARENTLEMDENAVRQYMQYYFMVKRPAEFKAASEKWLSKIEKKSGVKKTESGLLYKVTEPGDTTFMARDNRDKVSVHYVGRTREGKVFDASKFASRSKEQQEMLRKQYPDMFDEEGNPKEEKPAEFQLDHVIKGWTEGIKLIGKGGKITLWIPSDLAYGPRGAGRDIGPNEALEFEVELLDVTPYEEPAPAAEEAAAATSEE